MKGLWGLIEKHALRNDRHLTKVQVSFQGSSRDKEAAGYQVGKAKGKNKRRANPGRKRGVGRRMQESKRRQTQLKKAKILRIILQIETVDEMKV